MNLTMTDLRTDLPALRRDMAAAIRLIDPFTLQPIQQMFSVSIPLLRWSALWRSTDRTYRFSTSQLRTISSANPPAMPSGIFSLQVDLTSSTSPLYSRADPAGSLPAGPYAVLEPLSISLPLAVSHPPPVLVSDYLTDRVLFPTLSFPVPAGETAIVGRIVSASGQNVSGLKIFVFAGAAPSPATPYTRSDSAGQFLYRLPAVKRRAGMPTTIMGIQVFSAAIPPNLPVELAVTPASVSIAPAAVGLVTHDLSFSVP